MSAIGILGGMGPQASNKLYEVIIRKTANYTNAAIDEDYPDIVLLNIPVPNFISDKSKLSEAKRILIEKTKLLEKANCSVNGIACNTVHLLLPDLRKITRVPFVSIPELVAEIISDNKYERVGLLATPTTLKSSLYDDAITDALIIRPDYEFTEYIERCIYAQLAGKLGTKTRTNFKERVNDFMKLNNLDTVILGCTELPLVYGDNKPKNVIDTIEVLADKLLSEYYTKSIPCKQSITVL